MPPSLWAYRRRNRDECAAAYGDIRLLTREARPLRYQDGSYVCTLCGEKVALATDEPTPLTLLMSYQHGPYRIVLRDGVELHRCAAPAAPAAPEARTAARAARTARAAG